jgi:hypothetical protein
VLSRRSLLAAAGTLTLVHGAVPAFADSAVAAPVLPFPPLKPLSFRILRNGSHVGMHNVTFAGAQADALTITTDVDIAIRIAFITVFRYTHNDVEKWAGGQFVSMDAKTDYNGEAAFANAHRENGGIVVQGSKAARYTAPPNALPASHWNSAELRNPMVNPENGMLLNPKILDEGHSNVALASGTDITATKFAWRGKDSLDLWYEPDGRWAALSAHMKDGSTLNYERV